MAEEFYTVLEFAHEIGKSRDRIYEWLRMGKIKGNKVTETGMWLIPATELERLKEGRELPGVASVVPEERLSVIRACS